MDKKFFRTALITVYCFLVSTLLYGRAGGGGGSHSSGGGSHSYSGSHSHSSGSHGSSGGTSDPLTIAIIVAVFVAFVIFVQIRKRRKK